MLRVLLVSARAPFLVYVHPQFRLDWCTAYQAETDRGIHGCHATDRCPACVLTPEGFALWGENGHRQGFIDASADLAERLEHRAATRGEVFRAGSRMVYLGSCNGRPGPEWGIPK